MPHSTPNIGEVSYQGGMEVKGLVPLLGRGRGIVMREGGSLPGLGGGNFTLPGGGPLGMVLSL